MEFRRLYQLLSQQVTTSQMDTDEVCRELGRLFKDGQIEALNRVLTAQTTGQAVSLSQQGSTPALYIDSSAGSGAIIDTSVGASLTEAGVWDDSCTREGKIFLGDPDLDEIVKGIESIYIGKFYREGVSGPTETHFAPVAEDFHDTFNVGNFRTIAALDLASVALMALKVVFRKLKEIEQRTRNLEAKHGDYRIPDHP